MTPYFIFVILFVKFLNKIIPQYFTSFLLFTAVLYGSIPNKLQCLSKVDYAFTCIENIAILLINIVIVLDRTLAPLSRIEKIISEVLAGNHSLRVQVRKKDLLRPLVDAINQLIERVEK